VVHGNRAPTRSAERCNETHWKRKQTIGAAHVAPASRRCPADVSRLAASRSVNVRCTPVAALRVSMGLTAEQDVRTRFRSVVERHQCGAHTAYSPAPSSTPAHARNAAMCPTYFSRTHARSSLLTRRSVRPARRKTRRKRPSPATTIGASRVPPLLSRSCVAQRRASRVLCATAHGE